MHGIASVLRNLLEIAEKICSPDSSKCFNTSVAMSSRPSAFEFFVSLIALVSKVMVCEGSGE